MFFRSIVPRSARHSLVSRFISNASSPLLSDLSRGAPIDIHPEVQDALSSKKAVVALETTIVTHGMPYPVNLETAKSVENIVRENGAIPATIGLIGGRVKIGLEPHELEYLADVHKNSAVKISRRDIGPAIALRRDGGTTCSTTLIFAALAGIKVRIFTNELGKIEFHLTLFAMDISADLHELTRCPVGLVSAGVKSILDIGRTLEYLETLGVPVVSYAETYDFPAFYSRRSGFKSPWRVDDPRTAAQILYTQTQLGMSNGTLFGVPIPKEYESIGEKLQESVERAVREAEENGVSKRGKEATPWLLNRVGELTAGKSLTSNVALIENTARIGGQIAVAYAEMEKEHGESRQDAFPRSSVPTPAPPIDVPPAKLIVVGSAAVDVTAQAGLSDVDSSVALHTTVPGTVSLTLGGVARNVAEAAHRISSSQRKDLSSATLLIAPFGNDAFGKLLVDETRRIGMRTDGLLEVATARSAVCNMVLDSEGGLTGGVADMDVIHSLDKDMILHAIQAHQPSLVALDGNLSPDTLKSLVSYCGRNSTPGIEPTSVPKSTTILPAVAASLNLPDASRSPIAFATPNLLELKHMYQEACTGPLGLTSSTRWWSVIDGMALGTEFRMDLEQLGRRSASEHDSSRGTLSFLVEDGIAQMAINLLPFFQHLIIKCGDRGIVVAFRVTGDLAEASPWAQERSNVRARQAIAHGKPGTGTTVLKHFPALTLPQDKIVNVTGAGDSLVGSMIATLLQRPTTFEDPLALDRMITQAQRAAVLTLQSPYAVSPELSTVETEQPLEGRCT
ncbi:indigoidine synthase A-like protein [Amylocystis lapponica]|nr:indigoidine synthase A-like protein [Amylocystis lapponica]